MKKIAFIGRKQDLAEYCLDNMVPPTIFLRLDPDGHKPEELIMGLELQGIVVSDWASKQTSTKYLVSKCLRRIRY